MSETVDRPEAPVPAERQARRIAEALASDVRPLDRGGASRTFGVTGTDQIVTVPVTWPDRAVPADEIVRLTTLQRRIAERVTVPVPDVVSVLPGAGLVVVRRLEGQRLIDASPELQTLVRRKVAIAVGSLLAELHTWERGAYDDVADVDDYTPDDRRQEAAETARDLDPLLDDQQRRDVRRLLQEPVPAPAAAPVLSHNDLGIEHVLVATTDRGPLVSGVIDWDDAAICDPAHDFGLLLRDLGPVALDAALAAYAAAGATPRELADRARFYARCKLLEDLAFGHAEDRPEYVAKSIAGWRWTFDDRGGA